MRPFPPRVLALLCVSLSWLAGTAHSAELLGSHAAPIAISVQAGDWGGAAAADIERVVHSAARTLLDSFPEREPPPIRVIAGRDHPRVFVEKNAQGEYVVQLSAKGRRWAQYAYQFAHEFCHVLANFDNRVIEHGRLIAPHQWLEESLCELSAQSVLRRMAKAWESSPPVPEWKEYAPALAQFADTILSEAARDHAASTDLATWYSRHHVELARNAYRWERNEECAYLLMPLFEGRPGSWAVIGYLNHEKPLAQRSFVAYLESWRRSAPPEHQGFVTSIIDAFGLETELRTASFRSSPH